MSMAATLGLISKLASSIGEASSLSSMINALKSGAKSNLYALQVDSGEKKGWLVSAINSEDNPTVIDPNASGDSPITFDTKIAAQSFITTNELQYEYSETNISTISVNTLMEYNRSSDENIEKMASGEETGLAEPCMEKREEVISQGEIPTVSDYITAIKQKMSQWMPI